MKKQQSLKHIQIQTQKRLLVLLLMGGILFLGLNVFLRSDPKASGEKTPQLRQKSLTTKKQYVDPKGPKPLTAYSALLHNNPFAPIVRTNGRRNNSRLNGLTKGGSPLAPLPPLGGDLKVVPSNSQSTNKSKPSPYRYTGYVVIEGIPYALIEETKEGQSGYYRIGDNFGDFRINKILPERIVLASDRGTVELPRAVEPPPNLNRGRNNRQGPPPAPTPSTPIASSEGANPGKDQFQSTEVETPSLQENSSEGGNQDRRRGPRRRRFPFSPDRTFEGNAL